MLSKLHNKFQQFKSISFDFMVKEQLRSIPAQLNENEFVIERAFKKIDRNLCKKIQLFRYHSFDDRTASLISQLSCAHFSAQLELNEFIFDSLNMYQETCLSSYIINFSNLSPLVSIIMIKEQLRSLLSSAWWKLAHLWTYNKEYCYKLA